MKKYDNQVTVYYLYDLEDSLRVPRYVGTTSRKLSTRLKGSISRVALPSARPVVVWINTIGKDRVGIDYIATCHRWDRAKYEQWVIDNLKILGVELLNCTPAYPHPSD